MNWFKRNKISEKTSEKTTTNKVVTVGSIEEKLSNYQPKRERAVFEEPQEPQESLHGDIFEFKKVT